MSIDSPVASRPPAVTASQPASPAESRARATRFPAFFDAAPRILMQDALAETLGAAEGGILEY